MTALIMSSLLSLGFCGAPAYAAVTAESSSGTVTGNEDTGTVNGNTLNIVSGTTVGSAVAGSTITTVESGMTDSISADSVSGNTIAVTGGTVNSLAAGGLSLNGSVTGNSASMGNSDTVQSSAAVIAGGISGAGDANRNTLSFSGGSVSELAAGGFSDYGGASDNSVTMSGGSVYKLAGGASVGGVASLGQTLINDFSSLGSGLSYKGTTGGSTENNRVTMSGGSATYVWGAYNWDLTGTEGNVDVIGNQVTISDTAVVNGQVVGGEADAGSADNNAVIIKGGIINGAASGSGPKGMSVIGANTNVSDSGGANTNNSVMISGGTFGETAVAAGNRIIGAYSQSSDENISGNSVKISGGTVSSTNGSTVSLGGNDLALTTANVDNTSTLTLTSGKLTAEKLSDSITGGGKLTLDGTATLATTAGQVFTDGDTTETTAGDNGLTETAADSVNFKPGTLSLSDDYSYTYLTNIQKTMDALEDSTTSIVMTGNLVDTRGISNTLTTDQISSIGDTAALDTVTVTTEGSNISIGAPSSEDNTTSLDRGFNVAALDMGGADTVSVAGGQNLTLGDSETTDVITTDSGTASVNLAEGSTFTIGNSAVAENQTLNVAADVTAENSTIAANGQTTVTGDVALTDSALTSQTGTLTLEQNLTTSGTSVVTGDITVAKAITGDSSIILKLGNEEESVNLSARSINLNGGTLYLDPVWIGGTQEDGAEAAAGSISGSKVVIGNNSTLTVGSTDKTLAEKAFTDSGLTWSDTDILSALYVATSASLSDGSVVIDSSANADSAAAIGTFKMGKNSLLMIDGNKVSGSQAAAITDVSTTDISPSAKIYISNAKGNTTYNILSGTNDKDGNGLFAEARAAVNSNVFSYGHLLEFVGAEGNGETQFSVTAESQDAHDVYGDKVIAPNTINAAMDSGGAASAFALAASDDNLTEEAQESAFNSASALTELAGVQHGLYAANNLFDSSLTFHLTGLYTEDQDKDLWAHFIHSKENVRGLGLANMGASYDAQFNGVVVGSDFYKKGNATVGAALTYMDGSFSGNTEAAHTKNDVDYYGLALYGRVEQGPMTYLGDISYLHGSNDLKQHNSGSTITGSTDSDAYSIGVRAERGIGLGMGTLTPFAGLRYAHLGTDAYTDSIGVRHDSDDANVWMFPLGLRYSADIKNGIWTIRPMAEAGYVWTFGDRDGTDKVSLGGASDAFGFDIADAGSWYGRLGVQAAKGNFTYGVAYQYQHGTSVQSNTWTAAVRYHF